MAINESANWNGGEINISPDNIDVRADVIMMIEFGDKFINFQKKT